jgi:hypothetical protein
VILVALVAACLLTVPLTGGDLRALAEVQLRGTWTPALALALQVLVVSVAPDGHRALHAAVHLASYALLLAFLAANRRLPGVLVITTGTALNVVAIALNGGVMPASATAERLAGLTAAGGFANSRWVAHPALGWLGDVIPVPRPLANVMSAGDIIIFAGVLVLAHRVSRRASPQPRTGCQRCGTPGSVSSRSAAEARRSSRETCICEQPIRSAISDCVRSRSMRRHSAWRSR